MAKKIDNDIIDIDLSITRKKRFRIDGDNDRILELNTSDMNVIVRLSETQEKLDELARTATGLATTDDLDEMADKLKSIDNSMREYIDYIFDANVSEVCAPSGSMWDPINGSFRYEHIITVIANLYDANYSQELKVMASKIKNHTDKYAKKKTGAK